MMNEQSDTPETLWLQWHGDSDESETGPVAESEVTWCRDRIFARDIEYVRADVVRETIMANLHLADGDDCTLKRLKDAIGFEMPPEGGDQ